MRVWLSRFGRVFTACACLAVAGDAVAQTGSTGDGSTQPRSLSPKWVLEFGVSQGLSGWGPMGAASLPAAPPFIVLPLTGSVETQQVSSWLFGAGAALINRVNANHSLAASDLTSLDRVLTASPTHGPDGLGIRFSLAHGLENSRAKMLIGLALHPQGGGFSADARKSVMLSSERIQDVLGAIIGGFGDPNSSVKASLSTHSATSASFECEAGIRLAILTAHRRSVYANALAGIFAVSKENYSLGVMAEDKFSIPSTRTGEMRSYDETDSVRIQMHTDRLRPFLRGGLGFSVPWTERYGLQAEGSFVLRRISVLTTVDASPATLKIDDPGITHTGILSVSGASILSSSGPVTALVFDDNLQLSGVFPSTLSGPAIQRFETFHGSGWTEAFGLTAGIYIRF